MRASQLLLLVPLLWAGSARAAPDAPGASGASGTSGTSDDPMNARAHRAPPPAPLRLELRGGLSNRQDKLTAPGTLVDAQGTALSNLALGGAWFAGSDLGVAAGLDVDRFSLRDPSDGGGNATATGVELWAALAGRHGLNAGRLLLEAQLGYGFLQTPLAQVGPAGPAGVTTGSLQAHGPVAAAGVVLALADTLALEVSGRLTPISFGGRYRETALAVRRLGARAGVGFGRVPVGDFAATALLAVEVGSTVGQATGIEINQLRRQLSLGLRVTPRAPVAARAIPVVTAPPPSARGRVRGIIRTANGAATAGAPLSRVLVEIAAGPTVTTDHHGRFSIDNLGPGLITLRLSREDLIAAREVVSLPAGGDVEVVFTLKSATVAAPAVVTGLVRSETGSPVTASVRLIEPGLTAQADAKGHFHLEVPAGNYTLVIEAPGFVTQRKNVVARAAEHNIYDVDLQEAR